MPAEYDRHPDRYQNWYSLLLWHFKYVVSRADHVPGGSLDRTYAVLDDMQRRYQAGGHSLHAVYQYRWLVAEHIGDRQAADDWYAEWFTAPWDEHLTASAVTPRARWRIWWRGAVTKRRWRCPSRCSTAFTCTEQPQSILTELLVPYLRTGLEQAVHAHRAAYRAQRDHRVNLTGIAEHLHFCAVTGNQVRGLELMERHLRWLERPPSPFAAMRFAAAAALVLRRLVDEGHGDHEVKGADATVAVLADRLAERATELAARFDHRNGTTHQSSLVEQLLTAEPLVEYLPLSPTAARLHARLTLAPTPTPEAVDLAPDAPVADVLAVAERQLRGQSVGCGGALAPADPRPPGR